MAKSRTVVILAITTTVLSLCCGVLIGIVIWQVLENSEKSTTSTNTTDMLTQFPGYFRTPDEQALYARLLNFTEYFPVANSSVFRRCIVDDYCELYTPTTALTNTPSANTTPTATFFKSLMTTNTTAPTVITSSPNTTLSRKRRAVDICYLDGMNANDLQFHGCCVSSESCRVSFVVRKSSFITPSTLPEAGTGIILTIPHFNGRKQYFVTEECCQAQDCPGCRCSQSNKIVSAVALVFDGRSFKLDVRNVLIPGCCKCLNISPYNS